MKKLFVFIMLLVATTAACAQDGKGNPARDYYCIITPNAPANKTTTASVVWGNSSKFKKLVDDSGNNKEFHSIVDMLNYMSEEGWEYVEKIDYYNQMYAFLLKKKAQNEIEAQGNLVFKE